MILAFLMQIQPGQSAISTPPLPVALARAAAFCEEGMSLGNQALPPHVQTYMNVPRPYGHVKTFAAVPSLVRRFASTMPMGKVFQPGMIFEFKTASGQIWAVTYSERPACDIMVTGANGVPDAAEKLVSLLTAQRGWSSSRSTLASAKMPLTRHVLLKRKPQNDDADYAFRTTLSWPSAAAADKNGVQFEMGVLAGTVKQTAASR